MMMMMMTTTTLPKPHTRGFNIHQMFTFDLTSFGKNTNQETWDKSFNQDKKFQFNLDSNQWSDLFLYRNDTALEEGRVRPETRDRAQTQFKEERFLP